MTKWILQQFVQSKQKKLSESAAIEKLHTDKCLFRPENEWWEDGGRAKSFLGFFVSTNTQ